MKNPLNMKWYEHKRKAINQEGEYFFNLHEKLGISLLLQDSLSARAFKMENCE